MKKIADEAEDVVVVPVVVEPVQVALALVVEPPGRADLLLTLE